MILISENITADIDPFLPTNEQEPIFILTDTNTEIYCLPLLKTHPRLSNAHVITIPSGDEHKNLNSLTEVWHYLSDNGATRHSLLINLGGGMITDMGGFAAATFKRGMDFINIPTTLLGAIDAATGGKTGINYLGFKNVLTATYKGKKYGTSLLDATNDETKTRILELMKSIEAKIDSVDKVAKTKEHFDYQIRPESPQSKVLVKLKNELRKLGDEMVNVAAANNISLSTDDVTDPEETKL